MGVIIEPVDGSGSMPACIALVPNFMLLDICLSLVTNLTGANLQRLFKKLVNANRKSLYLLLWMSLVPLLTSSGITVLAFKFESSFDHLTWLDMTWVYALSSITMALAFTPTTFIALLSGFFVGMKSIPWLIMAYQIASLIGYSLARKIDHGSFVNSTQLYPKAHTVFNRINDNPMALVILARISPVLPFAIMNVVLSISGLSLKHFFWGGLWGMLPRTLIFLWVGTQASLLIDLFENSNQNRTLWITTATLLLISVIGLYLYFARMMSTEQKPNS